VDTGWPTAPNRSVKRKRLAPPRAPVYTDGGKTKPRDGKTCAETPSAVTVIFKDISGRSITYASRVRPFVFIPVVRPSVDVHYRNLREPTLSFAKRVRPFVIYIYYVVQGAVVADASMPLVRSFDSVSDVFTRPL